MQSRVSFLKRRFTGYTDVLHVFRFFQFDLRFFMMLFNNNPKPVSGQAQLNINLFREYE